MSGYPEKTRLDLLQRRQQINNEQKALQEKIAQSLRDHRSELREAAQTLAMATPYAELSEVLQSRGGLAVMTGWVPEDKAQKLDARLRRRIGAPLVVTAPEPLPGEVPPSTMRHHRFLQPFVALVKNYGIPRYGEFDPTLFFAFTYIAMFGMMFGDVGHGAVIAVAGFSFRRRLQKFAPFLTAAGLASIVFGFLYGSIFGFEEWLQPLWIAPLSDPTRMLMVALYWGIGRLAEYRTLHSEVREALEQGYHWLALSQMRMGSEMLRQAAVGQKPALQVKILPRSDIGVEYPAVTAESLPLQPVGLMWTDPSFDETRAQLAKVAVLLARLGEAETVLWRFLEEWRRTQKRVNALKYNVLPRYRETFRYIESELEEDERNMLFQIRALRKTSANEANEESPFLPKS